MKKLLILLSAFALTASAQEESGTWTSAGISKKVSKRLSLDGELELRTANTLQNIDSWRLGFGAGYKLTPWLKANAGYTFIYDYNPRDTTYNARGRANKVNKVYFSPRHRLYASLTASKNLGDFSLQLRERWQYTWRPQQDGVRMDLQDDEDSPQYGYTYSRKGSASHVWRNRLKLGYQLGKKFQPYLSGETYYSTSFDKFRLKLGTDISLSKHHSLDVGYLFQRTYTDTDANRHILNIGYEYKF